MDKREIMLHIVDTFERHAKDLPEELKSNFTEVKHGLNSLSASEMEQVMNHTFTSPPYERKLDENSPTYLLQKSYSEMERIAREQGESRELTEVIEQMQHVFQIEEKDGFFP